MERDPANSAHSQIDGEGRVRIDIEPTGKDAGPGKRKGIFFNPAMVQNRDLSVLIIENLLDKGELVGKRKRVLDGLCGSGIRALRMAKETSLLSNGIEIMATDIDPDSIRKARELGSLNDLDVEFMQTDLNVHLSRERYSYIDIDPFGSPLPFLASGITGTLNGGVLAFTATDTAALSGSIPRVARRRYGVEISMTHCYQEMSCRSLLGYVARLAASLERGIEPLFIYSSDHFIRGYARIFKGAKKADRSLENIGWMGYRFPIPPERMGPVPIADGEIPCEPMGPVWTGALEDEGFLTGLSGILDDEERWGYMSSLGDIRRMIARGLLEYGFPPGGYDVNETSSHLKVSPPSMDSLKEGIEGDGGRFVRSRFSPTIFKTDLEWEEVMGYFKKGGD
ncbi:MAG: hypothetical protein ACMUHB_05815 [Thermoplasmatota archaeon]